MLAPDVITAWAVDHPWPTTDQVEQDLLLSQAICEIANDRYLGEELTFRGGTCLHKLHVDKPYRYSEDLDYVRTTAGGIGQLTQSLTELGERLGYTVRSRIGEHPKVYWRATASSGAPIRIKVEVNTHERSPALPHVKLPYGVETSWWSGQAEVKTFQIAELVATKIRALYQRAKGRDVFDQGDSLSDGGFRRRACGRARSRPWCRHSIAGRQQEDRCQRRCRCNSELADPACGTWRHRHSTIMQQDVRDYPRRRNREDRQRGVSSGSMPDSRPPANCRSPERAT